MALWIHSGRGMLTVVILLAMEKVSDTIPILLIWPVSVNYQHWPVAIRLVLFRPVLPQNYFGTILRYKFSRSFGPYVEFVLFST
jgi:hypothetical protein